MNALNTQQHSATLSSKCAFLNVPFLLPFFLLFFSTLLEAQPVNSHVKDVVMPAPNAAALGKYGDYSVGNFTGVPDIGIPIHTVEEGSLSLPIRVNYHASGIKVAETASWVGAGWSLNAGGIISRTIQGIADEESGKGYYEMGTYLQTQLTQATSAAAVAQIYENIANGLLDGEPDMFSFNVVGYSGKFYIDANHTAHFIPKQDLKLEVDANLQGFTITTPEGTRYIFGRLSDGNGGWIYAQEKSLTSGQPSSQISSWYLMKIESADKKYSISLNYADEAYSYINSASGKRTLSFSCGTVYSNNSFSSNANVDATHFILTTHIQGKKISQIIISGENIPDSIVEYLSAENMTEAGLGDVWKNAFNIGEGVPEISFTDSLRYASAVGLALPSEILV